jgi:hypothetical protein
MRWFVLVVLVGCGGRQDIANPDAPPNEDLFVERSGTRLVRRGIDVDGTKLLNQIFDVARGEPCTPQRWTDGNTYCTPYENTTSTRYADAACTQPAAVAYLDASPTYAVRYAEGECVEPTIVELHRLGARLAQTEYYVNDGGECRGYGLSDIEGVFARGAPVVPAELVAVSVTEPIGTHRLRRRFIESGDGLRVGGEHHDRELGADCYLGEHADEQGWTCFPRRLGYTAFADAACATSAIDGGRCEAPVYASEILQPGCPFPDYAFYRVGAQIGTEAYVNSGGVCTAQGYETKVYARGEQVTPAEATRATIGDGRIQRVIARGEDDFPITQLFDRELGARCNVTTATDGSSRCLPQSMPTSTMYRDAACTQPVEVTRRYIGNEGCPLRPPLKFAAKGIELTPLTYAIEVRTVTGPWTGPLYQGPDVCEPVSPRYHYFALGDVLPPSAMATAVPASDP